MYKKSDFKCVDGLYYIGDVIDVDGNPWVDEEQLELIILELNNGWEDYQVAVDQDNQRYENSLKLNDGWEDLGPEYDSAGFTEEDRIVNGQYRNIQPNK